MLGRLLAAPPSCSLLQAAANSLIPAHYHLHQQQHPPTETTLAATTTSRSFTSLPVVDVGALVAPSSADAGNGGSQAAAAAAAELHRACRDVGFFYATNHGVPPEVSGSVLTLAHQWFQLPAHVKQQLLLSPATNYRGYQPLGTNVTRHESGFTPDWHEALDYYREEDPAAVEAAGRATSPIHGRNPWPTQVPGFAAALQTYISCMQGLGAALLRGIAMGLQLPPEAFAGDFAGPQDSYWVTRIIHYPPLAAADERQAGKSAAAACGEVGREVQLSCGEHTDYGLLTLVNQDPHVSALQVKNAAGQWVDAPPVPGTFVCNIGDCFQVLTNGLYTPTLHRVLNTAASTPRVSVPFFYEPSYEAVVQPLPQLCQQQPPLYSPLRYGSHLESKVLSNFELDSSSEASGAASAAASG